MALEEEQDVEITELNELQNSLTGLQDQNREFLQNQILPLTAQNTKLERNLNAQQGFLETIVTAKNGSLESELQTLKDEKITQVQDLKRGLGKLASSQPELRQIMNQVYDNEDGNSKVAHLFKFVVYFQSTPNLQTPCLFFIKDNVMVKACPILDPVKIISRIGLKQTPTIPDCFYSNNPEGVYSKSR